MVRDTSPRATVLIPTHSHGETLRAAATSALRQTVDDIEVLIIGDGMTPETREAATQLQRRDERVRVFDHPKGPRHGEVYRHEALTVHARGHIVCYLSDDDLWLPNHVETMEHLLQAADFAHGLSVIVRPEGDIKAGSKIHFDLPGIRERILTPSPRIGVGGLTCTAHTMDMYRRLPEGWETTPVGIATDVYMNRKFIAAETCRPISGTRPTSLRFPNQDRRAWPMAWRTAELEEWLSRMKDPVWRQGVPLEVLDSLAKENAEKFVAMRLSKHRLNQAKHETVRLRRAVLELRTGARRRLTQAQNALQLKVQRERVERKEAQLRERWARKEIRRLQNCLRTAQNGEKRLVSQLRQVRRPLVERAGRRVAAWPVLGRPLRAVARFLRKR